ncbi:MAG TPA: hypothetical protein QF359_09625 [Rhodospirillales bacterium]|nr:hypothetical protein [Rhodospirillales bacterium]
MFKTLKSGLANHFKGRAMNSSRKAVQDYIIGLRQMTDQDLGVILAVSTVIRINMENQEYLPKGLYSDQSLLSTTELGRYQMDLNKLVRDFNKMKQHTDAVGTLLISYSLRCLNVPEVRDLGREMWAEMQRGYPHVKDALKQGEEEKGESFPERAWQEWQQIPVGLEPLDDD